MKSLIIAILLVSSSAYAVCTWTRQVGFIPGKATRVQVCATDDNGFVTWTDFNGVTQTVPPFYFVYHDESHRTEVVTMCSYDIKGYFITQRFIQEFKICAGGPSL